MNEKLRKAIESLHRFFFKKYSFGPAVELTTPNSEWIAKCERDAIELLKQLKGEKP